MKKITLLLLLVFFSFSCSKNDGENKYGVSRNEHIAMEMSLKEQFKNTYTFVVFSEHKILNIECEESPLYKHYFTQYHDQVVIRRSAKKILLGEEPEIPIILPPYKDMNTYYEESLEKEKEYKALLDNYKNNYVKPIYSLQATFNQGGSSSEKAVFFLSNSMRFEWMELIYD